MPRAILCAAMLLLAAAAGRTVAEPAAPAETISFQAFVEQDGVRTPLTGTVHLKPAPFSLVFRGEAPPAYDVATSLDARALDADLRMIFASGHGGAEGDQGTDLFVNAAGTAVGGAHWVFQYWLVDNVHNRFSRVGADDDGLIGARKDIGDVLIGEGRPIPMARWSGGPIDILVASAPPTPGGAVSDPKRAVLVFDRGPPLAPLEEPHLSPIP